MNINLIKLKGVVRELSGIRHELSRLADCWELELAHQGVFVKPPKTDTSGPEPVLKYTDEEEDYVNELIERDRESRGKPTQEAD